MGDADADAASPALSPPVDVEPPPDAVLSPPVGVAPPAALRVNSDRLAAHLSTARAHLHAGGQAPGPNLLHAEAAWSRLQNGDNDLADEVVLSHVISRPQELLTDASAAPEGSHADAPAAQETAPEAGAASGEANADVTSPISLPIAQLDTSSGPPLVLMLLVSFLSELCLLVCAMDNAVTGLPCSRDTSRSDAVRMVDAAVAPITDTPLHSFLLGQSCDDEPSSAAGHTESLPLSTASSMVVCTPVPFAPPPQDVVRTPQQLARQRRNKRARQGAAGLFVWCTLSALAGHELHGAATQAFFTCSSFLRPTADLQMAHAAGHQLAPATLLRVGAGTLHSVLREPVGRASGACPYAVLRSAEVAAKSAQQFMLSFEHSDAAAQEYVRSWGAVLPKPDFSRLPKSLLERIPSFADPALATLAFSRPCQIPSTPWLPMGGLPTPEALDIADPLPSGLPRLTEAWSLNEILSEEAIHRIQRWLQRFLADLKQIAQGGVRKFNQVLVIGQGLFQPRARGIVWDRRAFLASNGSSPMVPMQNHVPQGQINWRFFEQHLPADYPDQGMVSDIRYGVRFRANLPLQLVLVPHLIDVNKNFASLQAELRRLAKLHWYDLYTGIPFLPGRFHAQGLVDRRYEPGRPRRKTDAGCPRKETYDSDGVLCPSLNDAIKQADAHLDLPLSDPDDIHTTLAPSLPTPCNWPHECKSMLHHVEHDLAILNSLAFRTKEHVYGTSDDIKDFFNHLKLAPDQYWMACLMTLTQAGDDIFRGFPELAFVSERVLGFGYSMASNIAQRFADAMLVILRRFMDELEAPCVAAHPSAAFHEWRRTRLALGGETEARRYVVHQYTDDQIGFCVGVECLANFELAWRRLTDGLNLIMAIPIKRQIGVVLRWMGVDIYTFGVVAIPDDKAARAIDLCTRCIEGASVAVERYHSLVGQLQHLRGLLALGREAMYSLYNPFRAGREASHGPQAPVVFTDYMKSKLHAFKVALITFMGAPVTWALPDSHRPNLHRELVPHRAYAIFTDACKTYGLGAWLHGHFYILPLTSRQLLMPIGVLEFLAVAVAFAVFGRLLKSARNILIRTDSQPIPLVLADARARAATMQFAHDLLEQLPAYAAVKRYVSAAHIFGPHNFLADAASRNARDKLLQFCAQLRVRPQELEVPPAARRLVEQVEAHFYTQSTLDADFVPKLGPSSSSPLAQEVIEHMSLLSSTEIDALLAAANESSPSIAPRSGTPSEQHQPQSSLLDAAAIDRMLVQPAISSSVVPQHSRKRARGGYLQEHMREKQHELLANFSGDKAALAPFLQRAAEHAVAGRKANTASIEDSHMHKYWLPFARKIKVNPWLETPRTPQETLFQRWLFAAFLEHVRDTMQPRSAQDKAAKPQSSMAVLNNVIRVLERPGEQLAPRITAQSTLAGILLEHIENFGALSLVARRKRGLTNELIDCLHQTPDGFNLPGATLSWVSITGLSLRAAFNLLADTGMRNAEVGTNETPSMTLAHVTYWLSGRMHAQPPPAYRMKRGDYAVVIPGVAKNDPWLENFAGDAIWLEYTGPGKRCTAQALFAMDVARNIRGEARTHAPLFVHEDGSPLKSTWLSSVFYKMMCAIVGEAEARHFSIHSFRIFVATALRKAGASHALIKSLVRWKNDESVDLYGKILPADFALWHRKIRSQRVQVLQTAQIRALAAPVAAPTFVSPAALDPPQKRKPGGQLGVKRGPYMTAKRRALAAAATANA